MAQPKANSFRLQKRFEVWAEVEVTAGSFDEAVALSKKVDFDTFFRSKPGVSINAWNVLPGTGVLEDW